MFARFRTDPLRLKWAFAGFLSLAWFIVYLTTVSPTVNFIDSGELITALNEPGIAHSPGYPLYVLMGYVATHLLWGDVAWRVNVMSAFWGALAVGTLFVLIIQYSAYIIEYAKPGARRANQPPTKQSKAVRRAQAKEKQTARSASPIPPVQPDTSPYIQARAWLLILSAAGGASLLAASSSFWSRTAQAKMYSLHFFLVFVILMLALKYRRVHESANDTSARRWLIALAAILGLSFTNHLMTVLLAVPLSILLLAGSDVGGRFRALFKRLPFALVAFALPLLLYLYLPLRASQNPIMNWGSPDSWGDFWRHISGWQFRPYLLGDIGGNLQRNTELVSGYATVQWGLLTVVVVLAGLAGAVLLARANWPVLAATAGFALVTLIFSLFYGISEIEPYMVPFYAMFALWVGLAPASWLAIIAQRSPKTDIQPSDSAQLRPLLIASGAMLFVALLSAALVYPTQNYSKNRLAEQFVMNVFDQLPQNSMVITDYWDFYAPTYYLQMIKGVRPDIVLVDKSLLRYPFYTQQLRNRYPWLIEKSQDIVSVFAPEQRKWVDGDLTFNGTTLNKSYFDLMSSFVERNQPDHPAYLLVTEPCDPNVLPSCEANQIAPKWTRQPVGLVTRLLPEKPGSQDVPVEPNYKLDGILTDYVPFDDAARINTDFYVEAYLRLAAVYGAANQPDKAQRMSQRATAIRAAIKGR